MKSLLTTMRKEREDETMKADERRLKQERNQNAVTIDNDVIAHIQYVCFSVITLFIITSYTGLKRNTMVDDMDDDGERKIIMHDILMHCACP